MDKKDLIIKQIEHIINYEREFYDNIDDLVMDLENILKGRIVFDEFLESEDK